MKNKINEILSISYDKMIMYEIKIRAHIKFKKKYFPDNKIDNYLNMIMDVLVFNKNCHLVTIFKDYMILDYIDEFLKRYYQTDESKERIPRFANFYKNYLKFFCKPTFSNFQINDIIQEHSEKKAELYYNQNFRNKKDKNNFDEGLFEDDDESYSIHVSKSKIEKTIFNETIKKQIDENSLGLIKTEENSERTINLQSNDFIPNHSFLYTKNSNEESLLNAINAINGKNLLLKNKKIYQPKINYYLNNSNNKFHSKLLSYSSLCQKKNTISISKNSNIKDSIKEEKIGQTKSQNQFKIQNMKKSRNKGIHISNNNLHTITKLDLQFKTYDIVNGNVNNNNFKGGISLLKTQNVENLLNKFQKNIVHKKKMYSIDNLLNKNNRKKFANSISSNLNYSKKGKNTFNNNNNNSLKRQNNNSLNKKKIENSHSKNRTLTKNNGTTNKKIPNHHTINYLNNNDDIVKMTLTSLINNENKTNVLKSPKHHRVNSNNNNNKNIQNVNININNQINISNNQFQEIMTTKINNKLLKNEKIDLTINSNLKNIINEKSKKLSRNKGRSIDLRVNTISTSHNQNSVYRSCSGLDKKMLTSTLNNNLYVKSPNKSITSQHGKNNKFSTTQLIKSIGKYKVLDLYSKTKTINHNLTFKRIHNRMSPKTKNEKQ